MPLSVVGVYELFFLRGHFNVKNLDNIDFVFLAETSGKWNGPINVSEKDYSGWKICRKIDKNWHPALIKTLRAAGLK
jgi:hypothetical protein